MAINDELINKILAFRDEREWKQFHNGKDLAISLNLEASELLELFQWSGTNLTVNENKALMEEELADIMMYCILFADAYKINLSEIIEQKLIKNIEKYPVSAAKGRSDKYDKLQKRN